MDRDNTCKMTRDCFGTSKVRSHVMYNVLAPMEEFVLCYFRVENSTWTLV
jgi:hypothetical protein